YMVSVPSFGDWGFVLADPDGRVPPLHLPDDAPDLRYLSADVLEAAAVIPPDKVVTDAEVSTMLDPVILEYTRSEWKQCERPRAQPTVATGASSESLSMLIETPPHVSV